jgi:pyruvate/2-oxoglutarate/acetoin dehydrogenase E1 component
MTVKNYYKLSLISANKEIAVDPKVLYIGYGLQKGYALGTIKDVPFNQIIEMPVAENLMIGFAIGLALKGYKPIVFIERMDFIMNALDAIVNHLDKIQKKSVNEFSPAIIIRCIVGNKNKPLYTGITHTQDHSEALRLMVSFPVIQLKSHSDIEASYRQAKENLEKGVSTILVEYKDLI